MKFSIAIPTYEMNGVGEDMLEFSFSKLKLQNYTDFEVVISDHSTNDSIKNLCQRCSDKLNIVYIRNEINRGSSSSNVNTAIKHCNGDWIKILFQDDFLYDENSMSIINEYLENNLSCKWLVTACEHSRDGITMNRPFYPMWNENILFANTISSPSVLTIKNENIQFFDENLLWLMDTEYYFRLYLKWGYPQILNQICVVNRQHANQVTNNMINDNLIQNEKIYIKQKYGIL